MKMHAAFENAVLPDEYYLVDKAQISPAEIIALRESVNWKGDTVDRWQQCISQSLAVIGVRDAKAHLVGMACVAGNVRHAVLCDLAVNPAHQNKGIGAVLTAEALKAAGNRGVTYLYTELADTNPFREQLLESGFRVTGDSLFMEMTF